MAKRYEPRAHVIDAELANGNLDAWKQALGFPRVAIESWYCEPCAVAVYERRCPHCGKLECDKA